MIIRFAIENWRSFQNKAELNMTATKERQHVERLANLKKLGLKLLPVSAIFGANASGKTKFVEALSFAQNFILEGVSPRSQIAIQPFKLDPAFEKKPSTFSFDLLINELIYSYSFTVSSTAVIEERLTIQNSSSAYEIFSRKAGEPMTFGNKLVKDVKENVLRVMEDGTRDNMLFLTNANSQKIKSPILNDLYEWFEKKLTVITPNSRYIQIQRFADKDDAMTGDILRLLSTLDTGIDHLEEVLDQDVEAKLSVDHIQQIKNVIARRNSPVRLTENSVAMQEDGKLVAKKIIPMHKRTDNVMVPFEFADESAGTRCILDLVPLFHDLQKKDNSCVYVIDELDRSLHVNITRWLLTDYLAHCSSEGRNQLIFTTHNVNLVDQRILRRDELWVVDRKYDGSSELYSFGEFKEVRNDKDIRKSYLAGLMGGVPSILS